jgi:restriction endonuclease Mrr
MAERKVRIAEKRIKMTEKGNDRKAKEILHSANAPFRMTKKRRGRVLSL